MADNNNNIETLSYKITVDVSDVDKAKDKIKELNTLTKEAQENSKKPITPTVNVEKMKEGTKAATDGKKAVDGLTESVNKMNQAAGGNSMSGATNAVKRLGAEANKAKMSFDDLKKILGSLDNEGISRVAKELDSILPSIRPGSKTIGDAMKAFVEYDEVEKGSKKFYDLQRGLVTKSVKIANDAGVELKSLQAVAQKPLDIKTDTSQLQQTTVAATSTTGAVKRLDNAVKDLGATMAQKPNSGGVTEGVKQFSAQATQAEIRARNAIEKVLQMNNTDDLENVARDINKHFFGINDDPDNPTSLVDTMVEQNYRGLVKGTPEYFEAQKKTIATLTEQVYKAGDSLQTLEKTVAKPVEVKANTQPIKQIATEATNAIKPVQELTRAVGDLGKTSAPKVGVSEAKNKNQSDDEQFAKTHAEAKGIRGKVLSADNQTLNKVRDRVIEHFAPMVQAGDGSETRSVVDIMMDERGSFQKGTAAYDKAERDILATLAQQMKQVNNVDVFAEAPKATKKVNTNASQANGLTASLNKAGKQMTQAEYNEALRLIQEDPVAAQKLAKKYLGKDISIIWEQMKLDHADGMRARGVEAYPELQKSLENRRQIQEVRNINRDRENAIQQGEDFTAQLKAKQKEARAMLAGLTGKRVTIANFESILEAAEGDAKDKLGDKFPKGLSREQLIDKMRQSQDAFDMATDDKERNKHQRDTDNAQKRLENEPLDRVKRLKKAYDRINNPQKYETAYSILSELSGDKVTKRNYKEIVGKLEAGREDKLGEDYRSLPEKDWKAKAKYLRDIIEEENKATQETVKAEKTIADTKTSMAKETTNTVAQETNKQLDIQQKAVEAITSTAETASKAVRSAKGKGQVGTNTPKESVDAAKEAAKSTNDFASAVDNVNKAAGKGGSVGKITADVQSLGKQTAKTKGDFTDIEKAIKALDTKRLGELNNQFSDLNGKYKYKGSARVFSLKEYARYRSDFDIPAGESGVIPEIAREYAINNAKRFYQAGGFIENLEGSGPVKLNISDESLKKNMTPLTAQQTSVRDDASKQARERYNEMLPEAYKKLSVLSGKQVDASNAQAVANELLAKVNPGTQFSDFYDKSNIISIANELYSVLGKTSDAKTQTAEQAKKAANEEANADKEAADAATQSAQKAEQAATQKGNAKKKSADDAKKSANEESSAEREAAEASAQSAQTTEQATTKKRRAKRKSADDTKKSANEEANAEKETGDEATKSADKVERAEGRKRSARKKSAQSAEDEAKAKQKRIAQLTERADKIASDFDSNLKAAPRGGNPKGAETYDKLQKRERKILDELDSLGVKRDAALSAPYEEYLKWYNANSSKVKDADAKAVLQEQERLKREAVKQERENIKAQKAEETQRANAAKAAARDAKQAQDDLVSYQRLQDRYNGSIRTGRLINPGDYQKMEQELTQLQQSFAQRKAEVSPFQMKGYDAYKQDVQASQARIAATQELAKAENGILAIRAKQNSLIARGKQLTIDQYQAVKTAGEEAQKRLQSTGSKADAQLPFDSRKYGDVMSFNREATIKNAMSWKNQGVDSYTNSINRLMHAQEALFSAYQRDPHPKYLQMLTRTRAELSRVTTEYQKYQHEINDTGTTMDKFMTRARSHLEWITSGMALSLATTVPMQFAHTLENLEARMAGIKQVIPMIEGLEDSEKFGTKEDQLARAKKEAQDLIGIAAKYGASVDEVMEAARSIGRMYGQGENGVINTNIMTAQATRMAVADAFDLIDATRGLESAMSQWNLQTEDSQGLLVNTNRILDVWTKTAHTGAASAQDIAEAIELAGTAANQAGVSFEFFNALVATGVRATARSGNEIGTSLKSMMVSMQTEKAEKALAEWGISLKEIGTDGVTRMRNLEDVILDVSMAVQATEKDTTELFLALSGGKYQYSKVSAMLKNGDELLRMLGEIHSPNTVGFTGQQIEVQLETLSRKVATIKDDLQGLVFNIGGIDAMKDFADALDNLIVGLPKLGQMFGSQTLTIAKWGAGLYAAWRTGITLAKMLGTAYYSFKLLQSAEVAATASGSAHVGVIQAKLNAYLKEWQALAAGRVARLGYVVAEKEGTAAATQETAAKNAETAAHVRNTEALAAEVMAWMRYGTVTKGSALQTGMSASAGAAAGAMSNLGGKVGLAATAVAALGGPIGIAITLLTILIPIIYEWASSLGEAENAMRKNIDTQQEHFAKLEQNVQKIDQSAEYMKKLANQYNKISDSLADCTEGTKEYTVKQEQLQRIKGLLMKAIEDETVLLDENGRVRLNAIDEWEKAELKGARTKLDTDSEKIKSDLDTTRQAINDAKERIASLKSEMEVLKESGKTWSWFSQLFTRAHLSIGNTLKDIGTSLEWDDMIKKGESIINSADKSLVGQEGSGDIDYIEEALEKEKERLKRLEDEKADLGALLWNNDELRERIDKGKNLANNPEERGTVEPDEEGGGKSGRGGRGSSGGSGGSSSKPRLPYESDELAAAIHEAAQTNYAKDNGLTEPLLRALAEQQSGMSQDFSDGVRVGAFGVTEEMGRRFGQDVYSPIGNAMTAVLALTQKISDAGGDVGAALNSFTGGNASAVYAQSKVQQDAYTFDSGDYFSSSDFSADVIAAARQRLGLPYGGTDLSDEFETVCTTFIQRALVDAGADEAIVRSLTADASNWSTNAGAAFHPYGDGYTPKPGDVAITGIHPEDNGHGWHVNLIDENGTGYYSAGGYKGESAHYDTPVESAYEGDIEGYIDIAAFTGKQRATGFRSKGRSARKSVFDFRRSSYEQLMYQMQKSKEDYEDEAKDIELERSLSGNSYALAAREELNEQAKLTAEKNTLRLLEAMYKGVQKSIDNTIANAPDLQVALGQEGAKWADLVPEEKKQLASLYKNDNGVFAELVNEELKLHDALREQTKVVKEQSLKAQKYLHMSIEEAAKSENERLSMKYENFEAGLPDDNDSFYLRHVELNRAKQEMLRGQIANQTTVRDYAYNQYTESAAKDKADMAELEAKIQAGRENLAVLRQQEQAGMDVAKAIEAQSRELTENIRLYEALGRFGSDSTRTLEKGFYQADTALKQMQKDLDKVAKEDLQNIRNYGAQMFTDLIVEGKSFEEVWQSLWKDLARYTINAIFGANNSGNIWGSIFSWFGGGNAEGGALAKGGRIPGYAQGGGMIKGAGTGTSDSILAYLANKDRFVYLSNGEYVMTAEATKRLGVENLDALNGYAGGGAIAPTPYVPTLSNRASKRVGVLSKNNPNARMEQLMQEQTNVIQGMSSGGNGQIVVLNTKASSSDVLKAMQENPRQVQAILGQQRRAGFK